MQRSESCGKFSATLQPRRNHDSDIGEGTAHGLSNKEHNA
jgi:hypothetical protein